MEVKIVFRSFKYILSTFQTVSKYSWIGKGRFSALIYINDMKFYELRTNVVTSPSLYIHIATEREIQLTTALAI